jgi:hypothetical protein
MNNKSDKTSLGTSNSTITNGATLRPGTTQVKTLEKDRLSVSDSIIRKKSIGPLSISRKMSLPSMRASGSVGPGTKGGNKGHMVRVFSIADQNSSQITITQEQNSTRALEDRQECLTKRHADEHQKTMEQVKAENTIFSDEVVWHDKNMKKTHSAFKGDDDKGRLLGEW